MDDGMTLHNVPHIVSASYRVYTIVQRGMLEVVLVALCAFYAKHVSTLQLKSLDGPTRAHARFARQSSDSVYIGHASLPGTFERGRTKTNLPRIHFLQPVWSYHHRRGIFSFEPKNFKKEK